MVSYAFNNFGGISGVAETPRFAYSKRGRDQDTLQNFIFQCDPNDPFSGIVHIQGSLDEPPQGGSIRQNRPFEENLVWVDIAELEFTQEGGSFFLQTDIELAHVRIVCRDGNYWAAAMGFPGGLAVGGIGVQSFTINGIQIDVNPGDDADLVAVAINSTGGIIADGTIVADAIGTNSNTLRIYKNDGEDLILANTVGFPLNDLGIQEGTYESGTIMTIRSMR